MLMADMRNRPDKSDSTPPAGRVKLLADAGEVKVPFQAALAIRFHELCVRNDNLTGSTRAALVYIRRLISNNTNEQKPAITRANTGLRFARFCILG
jgi:hypothetical protein